MSNFLLPLLLCGVFLTTVFCSPTIDPTENLFRKLVRSGWRRSRPLTPRKRSSLSTTLMKSTTRLRVTYKGSERSVLGCSAAIVHTRWLLLPRTCINGHIELSKSNADGVSLSAIYTLDAFAAIKLEGDLPSGNTPAKLASKTPSKMALRGHSGYVIEYQSRNTDWCSRYSGVKNKNNEKYACATPKDDEVCPARRGAIAFDAKGSAPPLIGFAKGGDCSSRTAEGVSWIALVAPYSTDIEALIAGTSSNFEEHY